MFERLFNSRLVEKVLFYMISNDKKNTCVGNSRATRKKASPF